MVSIFGWASTQLISRLDTMKVAEAALVNFSKRYGNNVGGTSSAYTMELFDTEISRSVVPLKDGACQISCLDNSTTTTTDGSKLEEDKLIMHGIKVVSKEQQERSSNNGGEEKSAPLVLLHGYANGALYFYRNLLGLADQNFGGTVYALDLLGWGLSSRPAFNLKKVEGQDEVETAEQFFVESLEAWRKEHKLDKMTLGGHSMGGYLSVAYCEKYPQHVDRLILLSPAGIPGEQEGKDFEKTRKQMPLRFRFMIGFASSLWKGGVTPSSFVRSLPESRGKGMVARYVEGRLPSITCPDERAHLTDYLYTNAILPGSGENCLNKLLKPMAFAKKPLIDRIPLIKVRDVAFVYGQHDWMTPSAGIDVQQRCDEREKEGKEAPKVEVYGVQQAGHLLMLENWQGFNNAVIKASGGQLPVNAPKPFSFLYTDDLHREFFARPGFQRRQESDDSDTRSNPSVQT